jgi:hypothetical protein
VRNGGLRRAAKEFLYGLSGYDFVRHALEERAALESLFMVTAVGDMVGLPVLPPYYSLRLLPFLTPEVGRWKHRVLRERLVTEQHDFDLHGV